VGTKLDILVFVCQYTVRFDKTAWCFRIYIW